MKKVRNNYPYVSFSSFPIPIFVCSSVRSFVRPFVSNERAFPSLELARYTERKELVAGMCVCRRTHEGNGDTRSLSVKSYVSSAKIQTADGKFDRLRIEPDIESCFLAILNLGPYFAWHKDILQHILGTSSLPICRHCVRCV